MGEYIFEIMNLSTVLLKIKAKLFPERCGWCSDKLRSFHIDWRTGSKVCHTCYLKYEEFHRNFHKIGK